MDSAQLAEYISASLDGELNVEETALLKAELRASESARRLQEELRADRQRFRNLLPMKAPAELKAQTLSKVQRLGAPRRSVARKLFLLAATALVVMGLFWYLRPNSGPGARLYFRPGFIAAEAGKIGQDLRVALGGQDQHVLVSAPMSGRFTGGDTRVEFLADAGEVHGGKILIRLAFDCDGDGVFESHGEPQFRDLDNKEGFQRVVCRWGNIEQIRDLEKGTVKVEVLNQDPKSSVVALDLGSENVHLEIPFADLEVHDLNAHLVGPLGDVF